MFQVNCEIDSEYWELLKVSYACLLHISEAKSCEPFSYLTNKVCQ